MLPRRRAARSFLLAFALVAGVHLVAQLAGAETVPLLTQVLLMPLLAGVLWCETSPPRGRLVILVLVALGLSWLGDSAPELAGQDAEFVVMVGSSSSPSSPTSPRSGPSATHCVLFVHRLRLLGYLAVVAALLGACAAGADALLVPVLVYGACLGTMAVLATGVNRLTAVGGAVFLVSDGLIALDVFVPAFGLPAQGSGSWRPTSSRRPCSSPAC